MQKNTIKNYSYHTRDNEAEKQIKINDMKSKISILINSTETALKLKNVRTIINDTYLLGMSEIFWSIIINISTNNNVYNNHISIWKLCQLIHQVLNKGSSLCCYYGAQQYINYLLNISTKYQNYNGDKYDNYGVCIIKYINLLIIKLNFHSKNHKIPTNLSFSKEHFDGDGLFQLAVEIFDYLDGIIDLQNAVFTTNLTYSIAPIMECRFMALSTLIEESKLLYFNVVQIMYTLHINFPLEILNGHRNRFGEIFKDIKKFYDRTMALNLFQNFMWIPKLTDNPPEFYSNNDIKLTNSTDPIIQCISKNNNDIQSAYNNVNELNNDENQFYDSDFDTSSEDDDDEENQHKNRQKLNRQNTLVGESPSAPSLDIILQDKEETIRKLKHRIEILEQKVLMKDFKITELKNELKNSKTNSKDYIKQNGDINITSTRNIENGYASTRQTIYKKPIIYDAPNPSNNNFCPRTYNLSKVTTQCNNNYPDIAKKPLLPNPKTNNISRLVGIGSTTLQKNQFDYQRSISAHNVNYGTIPRRINNQNVNKSVDNRKSVNFAEIKSFWTSSSTMIKRRED